MSEKLLESDFITVDLRSVFNKAESAESPEKPEAEKSAGGTGTATEDALPAKGAWGKWEERLDKRRTANSQLSSEARLSDYEVEAKFFKEFFSVNWGVDVGKKLDLIGEPLKKAFKALGFEPTKNPILAFILQDTVIKLINNDKLNANTFKAIYNAVAKRQVAPKEFFVKNDYNIIYCPDLYNKSLEEMTKYLELQKEVLEEKDTTFNKKVFLYTNEILEQDPEKRANIIKDLIELKSDMTDVASAKLNSLKLANLISDKKDTKQTQLNTAGQDKIVAKLSQPSDKFAAILALSLSTDSKKAKAALSSEVFGELDGTAKIKAILKLAGNNILPKGQLNSADADALVDKLMASMAPAE